MSRVQDIINDIINGGRAVKALEPEELRAEYEELTQWRIYIEATIKHYNELRKLKEKLPELIREYNKLEKELSKLDKAYVIKRDHERYGKVIWLIWDIIDWITFFTGLAGTLSSIIKVAIKRGLKKATYVTVEKVIEMIIDEFKDIKFFKDVIVSLSKEGADGVIKAAAEWTKSQVEDYLKKLRDKIDSGVTLEDLEQMINALKKIQKGLDKLIGKASEAPGNIDSILQELQFHLNSVNRRIKQIEEEIKRREAKLEQEYITELKKIEKNYNEKMKKINNEFNKYIKEEESAWRTLGIIHDEFSKKLDEKRSELDKVNREVQNLKVEMENLSKEDQRIAELNRELEKLKKMLEEEEKLKEYFRSRIGVLNNKVKEAKGKEKDKLQQELADLLRWSPKKWAKKRIKVIDKVISEHFNKKRNIHNKIKEKEEEKKKIRIEIQDLRKEFYGKLTQAEEKWLKAKDERLKKAQWKAQEEEKLYNEYNKRKEELKKSYKKKLEELKGVIKREQRKVGALNRIPRFTLIALALITTLAFLSDYLIPHITLIETKGELKYLYETGEDVITLIRFKLPQEITENIVINEITKGWSYIIEGNDLVLQGGTLKPGQYVVIKYSLKKYIKPKNSTVVGIGITTKGDTIIARGEIVVKEMMTLKLLSILSHYKTALGLSLIVSSLFYGSFILTQHIIKKQR